MIAELDWRVATAADVPALVVLIRAAYRGEASRGGWTSEADLVQGERIDDDGVARIIDAPGSAMLVVGEDREPTACCQIDDRGGGVAYLGTFAVRPRCQAGGLGRALIAEAERFAVGRLGADTLEIAVLAQLPALVAWYERRGFAATGETRPFDDDPPYARTLRDDLRFVVMRKPLGERAGRPACALSWSGGKDSALAFEVLSAERGTPPAALITTVTADHERISMHGVRRELLAAQVDALGVELVEVRIPAAASNDVYERRLAEALARPPLAVVPEIAFGDLFLADIRAYREARMAAVDRRAAFPLWHRETGALARRFIADGFRAIIVCVDPARLDPSFAGRAFDERLLADLPAGVDPCGENGEFHTFVHAGPIFGRPVAVSVGEVVARDGFVFCDLLPAAG